MAEIKGSALPRATTPTGFDAIGVQGGTSKKIDRDVLVGGAGIRSAVCPGYPFSITKEATGAATDFNVSVAAFPGANEPSSSRQNTVANIGWNVGADGAQQDPTEAMLRLGFEEHWLQGGYTAFEFHLAMMDTSAVQRRVISAFIPKDGGDGSYLLFDSDIINFFDYDHNHKIRFDFTGNVVSFVEPTMLLRAGSNNHPTFQQINAAGNTWKYLPYYDSDDRIRCNAPTVSIGNVPTTGPYPNCFAVFQAPGMPANGTLLQGLVSGVTGNAYAANLAGECSGDWITAVWNNTNNATANAVLELRTINTAAGDPLIRYNVNGGAQWQVGLDNSDADSFKWGTAALGSEDKMVLDTTGNLALPVAGAGLRVKEGSNAKQGVATLVAGSVVVSNTSVTANSRIFLTSQSDGGAPGFLRVSARTAGTSFTITSSSGSDTSVVAYEIFEPA